MRSSCIALLWLFALATTPNPVAAQGLRVGFVSPGFAEGAFWSDVVATMEAAAADLDIALQVRHSDRDRFRMITNLKDLLGEPEPLDYVVLVNEVLQGPRLLEMAEAAGVPVLFLLNTLTEEQRARQGAPRVDRPLWIGSLTPDNRAAGREMAVALIREAKRRGLDGGDGRVDMLALSGDPTTPASVLRVNGMIEAVTSLPMARLGRVVPAYWMESRAHAFMRRFVERGLPMDVLWSANDQMAFGAIDVMAAEDMVPGEDVLVAGLNWSPRGVRMVRDGGMLLTHGGHFLGGAWSMILLRDHYDGADFAETSVELSFPMTAITSENVDAYLRHFGDGDWGAVDFAALSRTRGGATGPYRFTLDGLLSALPEASRSQ